MGEAAWVVGKCPLWSAFIAPRFARRTPWRCWLGGGRERCWVSDRQGLNCHTLMHKEHAKCARCSKASGMKKARSNDLAFLSWSG